VIGAAILGIVAGFLARALMPGKQAIGFFATILLGIAGALVGFFFFTELLGIGDSDAFDLGGLPGAVIGSMVLLFVYERFVASRSAPAAAPATPRETREGRDERRVERRERRRRDRE
jgi:uncharacterized membrane protein YeaQ/YmgE (transglycosylase-associated protein family)